MAAAATFEEEVSEAEAVLGELYSKIKAEIEVADAACDNYQDSEDAQCLSLLGDFISVLSDLLPPDDEEGE